MRKLVGDVDGPQRGQIEFTSADPLLSLTLNGINQTWNKEERGWVNGPSEVHGAADTITTLLAELEDSNSQVDSLHRTVENLGKLNEKLSLTAEEQKVELLKCYATIVELKRILSSPLPAADKSDSH